MRTFRSLALSCAVAFSALAACGSGGTIQGASSAPATTFGAATTTAANGSTTVPSATAATAIGGGNEHDDPADYTWDEDDVVAVDLNGSSAASPSESVEIAGSTITITAAGTYRLSGALSNGQVVVADDDDVVRLIFDGVDITNTKTSPIAITDAAKVVVILADGTKNELADGATYNFADAQADEPNAALFSAADLTIAGTGTLTVDGNFNDATSTGGMTGPAAR